MEIIIFIIGLVVGIVLAWFILSFIFKQKIAITIRDEQIKKDNEANQIKDKFINEMKSIEARANRAEAECESLHNLYIKQTEVINELTTQINIATKEKTEYITRLEEKEKSLQQAYASLEEQKNLIERLKVDLSDTFKSLSIDVLKSSKEDFLTLARENLNKIVIDTKGKLDEHKESIGGTIKPLKDVLDRYEKQIKEMEQSHIKTFGSLTEQLQNLLRDQSLLRHETNQLITALRRPKVSGKWGELGLKNVVTLAGMTNHVDFEEQISKGTESGRIQPDMIVNLPNGRIIVIDSKAPVDTYFNAINDTNEESREKALNNYVTQIRQHINKLSEKAYWDQFDKSPELVVMYLPGESFFSVALEQDHTLIQTSAEKRIILATPTTLLALLKAIAYGWQQEEITKNALDLMNSFKELYNKFALVIEHYEKIGKSLSGATKSYNECLASMQTRLIPYLKKIKDTGISTKKEIVEPKEIEVYCKESNLLNFEFKDDKKENNID